MDKVAKAFLQAKAKERDLLASVNMALQKFSDAPESFVLYSHSWQLVTNAGKELKKLHLEMAAFMKDYEQADSKGRRTFVEIYFAESETPLKATKHTPKQQRGSFGPPFELEQLLALFTALFDKTRPLEQDSEEDVEARYRYLAYVLESMGDDIGLNQTASLLNHLGPDRLILITTVGPFDMSAGPVEQADIARGTKLGGGGSLEEHAQLYAQQDQSIITFLQSGYARDTKKGLLRTRKPNPEAALIGHVQMNLDKDCKLFAIFPGVKPLTRKVCLFSPPKYTNVHHEHGHLITLLKGKYAPRSNYPYKGSLSSLTDQEEANNIFGSKRSDRAYSELLELPVRFNHKLLIAYVELEASAREHEQWTQLLADGQFLCSTHSEVRESLYATLLQELRKVAYHEKWSTQAKGWASVPKGIQKLRSLLEKREPPERILRSIRTAGGESAEKNSKYRTPLTQAAYDLIQALDLDSKDGMKQQVVELRMLWRRLEQQK